MLPKTAFLWRKGQPEGHGGVQSGVEDAANRVGNPHSPFEEGVGKTWVGFQWRSGLRCMLRVGDLAGAGFGFRGNDGIAWVSILLLFVEPLSPVDFCFDGRGRGLGCGWGGGARNQSFDGYDHRKGFDLTGDGAPGYLVAEIGEFPEPGQDLV